MSAVGANGEEIFARTSQQHVLAADAPEQHAAVRKRADGNSFAEVRSWCVVGVIQVNLA